MDRIEQEIRREGGRITHRAERRIRFTGSGRLLSGRGAALSLATFGFAAVVHGEPSAFVRIEASFSSLLLFSMGMVLWLLPLAGLAAGWVGIAGGLVLVPAVVTALSVHRRLRERRLRELLQELVAPAQG